MYRSSRAGRSQRGNILFLILLAVVLFAALSYAVTQSMRGGGKDGGSENATLIVSQIYQYAALLDATVDRLMLVNGCSESQISFENLDYPVTTANPRAPSDKSCHMFEPEGGNLKPFPIQPDWLLNPADYGGNTFIHLHGHASFHGTRNIENTPTIASEMVWVIPFLNQSVCDEINNREGLTGNTSWGYWINEYLGPANFRNADTSNQKPYRSSCSTHDVGNGRPPNTFHYVLLER